MSRTQVGWVVARSAPGLLRPVLKAVVVHAGVCGFAVAVAACPPLSQSSQWIMGKRRDGRIPLLSLALWWPYHVGLQIKLHAQRLLRPENVADEVESGWWVSAWPRGPADLPQSGSTGVAVPDVTCELPRAHSVGPYLCLPTWDTNAVAVTDIERGVDWALAQRAMGRAVVVHCAHGHGRSATVMAACLLARGLCLNARDAEKYMQRSRPRVRLSRRQRASLEDWVAWRLRVRLAGCEGWGVRVRLKEGVVSLAMGSVAAASRGG